VSVISDCEEDRTLRAVLVGMLRGRETLKASRRGIADLHLDLNGARTVESVSTRTIERGVRTDRGKRSD
jgi:hypothetical protein